jgi:hypothetical protein
VAFTFVTVEGGSLINPAVITNWESSQIGYSESKFRALRVGMTARQVEHIMGPPLARGQWQVPDGRGGPVTVGEGELDDLWYYTRAGKVRGNFWRREVWFRNGAVYTIDSTYYLD